MTSLDQALRLALRLSRGRPDVQLLSELYQVPAEELRRRLRALRQTERPPDAAVTALVERFPPEQQRLAAQYLQTLAHLLRCEFTLPALPPLAARRTLLLLLSDLHVGKRVELPGHVYDLGRARSYCRTLTERLLGLQQLYQAERLLCLCLGDLVDGACIYDRQAYHLELDPHQQVLETVRLLWQLLETARPAFAQVQLVGVRGNHGRTGSYTPEAANWDLMVYMTLQLLACLARQQQPDYAVQVEYSVHEFHQVAVQDYYIQIRHQAPSQTETPAASNRYHGYRDICYYDMLCAGHFHHPGVEWHQGRPILMNGCFPGVDNLAQQLGKYSRPVQLAALLGHYPSGTVLEGIYPLLLEAHDVHDSPTDQPPASGAAAPLPGHHAPCPL